MTPSQPQSSDDAPGASFAGAKRALRDQLLTARGRRSVVETHEASAAIAAHLLADPRVRRAASVAAYVGVGAEPGTGALLEGLRAAGTRVLLPVVLPDLDLDWAVYTGPRGLMPARMGLLEPTGPRLGVDAVATPDVVLLPGLAVSTTGDRMGRGGGCYDRVLARVPDGTFTCVLLFDDEVGVDVPVEAHDRRVVAAASPGGIVELG